MKLMIERVIEKSFFLAATGIMAATLSIFGFMAWLGAPLLKPALFVQIFTQPWLPDHGIYGIAPMIMGTLVIAIPAVLMAFPLSLGTATLITTISPGAFGAFVKKTVHVMTGIPTVIYGFVGIFLLVPIVRRIFESGSGLCVLSASWLLAILISPTMILFFTESVERVPGSYLEAVDALGGNRTQKLLYVILPCAWRGIVAGILLSLGRAVGDTLIALMVAGNAVGTPDSILSAARTLTAHIALIIAADFDSLEFRVIFAAGLILYSFTVLLVLLVRPLAGLGKSGS